MTHGPRARRFTDAEVTARATRHEVTSHRGRQLRRMARYTMDGWTPGLLRAVAAAARRAGELEWICRAIAQDAELLAEYLAAQGLAGER